jgi:hypothetical protein
VQDLTPEGCERKLQGQFGIEYREEPDTFILFEIQLFSLNSMVRLTDQSPLSNLLEGLVYFTGGTSY